MAQTVQPEWAPEIPVTTELARALIAPQFPALQPLQLHRFAHGWDNAAYLVNERYVFRFPQRTIAAALMQTECAVLPLIAPELPLPIPFPEFIGSAQGEYPWTFAGYELVPGQPADVARLSDGQRAALAPALGMVLRSLHAIDPAAAIARGLPRDTMHRLDHARRFPLALSRLSELHAAGLIDPQPIVSWLERHPPQSGGAERECIVHGDLYARHVLVDADGALSGVLDWGDMHAGDRALDLMIAHGLLPEHAHAAFRSAYGEVDEATWNRGRYRALYHAVLVAHYGKAIGDADLLECGISALRTMGGAPAR